MSLNEITCLKYEASSSKKLDFLLFGDQNPHLLVSKPWKHDFVFNFEIELTLTQHAPIVLRGIENAAKALDIELDPEDADSEKTRFEESLNGAMLQIMQRLDTIEASQKMVSVMRSSTMHR